MNKLVFVVAGMILMAGYSVSNPDGSFHTSRLAAEPEGEPVLDPPTLHCLGAYWLVRGDDNHNARVEVAYRRAGTSDWKRAPDMLRVDHGPFTDAGDQIKPPAVMIQEGRMFAGSVLFLDENTAYEVRYNLIDPDGGSMEKIIRLGRSQSPPNPRACVYGMSCPARAEAAGRSKTRSRASPPPTPPHSRATSS